MLPSGIFQRTRWRILLVLVVALLLLRYWPHPALREAFPTSTAIYSRDGELLRLALSSDEQFRVWVDIADIEPRLIEAVQSYEDRWFFYHLGVNPIALLRAAFTTYSGGQRQGASTLTMQLARKLYGIRSQTWQGKLQQIAAALWLEARYSKREILQAYLNLAPYGGNIEGVGAASLIYFHKRAAALSLPESLLLSVIPQNPKQRGAAKITPSALLQARARVFETWLKTHPHDKNYQADMSLATRLYRVADLPFAAPHLSDKLVLDAHSDAHLAARSEVFSTLDMRLQKTVQRNLSQYVENHKAQGINNASAMLLDTHSGEVLALVGSVDYFAASIQGQVNGTHAKRSPGSTLKPFIYALALDQGVLHPQTILKDAPTNFGPFSPENFDGRFVGPITAQQALVRSRNIPAVAVANQLKTPTLYQFLQAAGVSKLAAEPHYGLALALGGAELSMAELAQLYVLLGNGGKVVPLRYQRDVADPVERQNSAPLLSEAAAFITVQMLKTNVRPDTARPASPAVAWKTGTSWGFRDAWTAGLFGRYVLVVWVGNFDGSSNPALVGIQTAAPLFFNIVDSLRAQGLGNQELSRIPPASVTQVEVCAASGELPNEWCKDTVPSWFIAGKSPIKVSRLHRAINIDTRTGQPSCEHNAFVHPVVFEFWSSDLQQLFRAAGIPRRVPPNAPACALLGSETAIEMSDAPQISSPNRGGSYTQRLSAPVPLSLRATVNSNTPQLFWFANDSLIGQSTAGRELTWLPAQAGKYQLRVLDSEGRSDSREIQIEFVP